MEEPRFKFRFWSKVLNRFVVPDSSILAGAFKDPYMAVMGYTGLKDKNGVEIYEGDIVKHSVQADGGYDLDVVEYKAPFMLPFHHEMSPEAKQSEVIGNRYENPELLAGDSEP